MNGASIPKLARPLIGYPWEGAYRQATVIHDYFCQSRSRHWRNVHRVFYEAMLTDGVGPLTARLLYASVYYFGPRWTSGPKEYRACRAQLRKPMLRDLVALCARPSKGGRGRDPTRRGSRGDRAHDRS